MAKPNYSFQKRQRDLAKKQKKEEKRLRKAGAKEDAATQTADDPNPGDGHQTADADGDDAGADDSGGDETGADETGADDKDAGDRPAAG